MCDRSLLKERTAQAFWIGAQPDFYALESSGEASLRRRQNG